jgi:hypothetical protein
MNNIKILMLLMDSSYSVWTDLICTYTRVSICWIKLECVGPAVIKYVICKWRPFFTVSLLEYFWFIIFENQKNAFILYSLCREQIKVLWWFCKPSTLKQYNMFHLCAKSCQLHIVKEQNNFIWYTEF